MRSLAGPARVVCASKSTAMMSTSFRERLGTSSSNSRVHDTGHVRAIQSRQWNIPSQQRSSTRTSGRAWVEANPQNTSSMNFATVKRCLSCSLAKKTSFARKRRIRLAFRRRSSQACSSRRLPIPHWQVCALPPQRGVIWDPTSMGAGERTSTSEPGHANS